jgi:hypothetical protein
MLVAVALLGALTHQSLSLWWPAKRGQSTFFGNYRAVRASVYAGAVVLLYVLVAVMGAILYPEYRLIILPFFYKHGLKSLGGWFELKEHFIAIGLGLLPLYWYIWKRTPLDEYVRTRAILTTILAVTVWYSFLVGHVVDNAKGFGS